MKREGTSGFEEGRLLQQQPAHVWVNHDRVRRAACAILRLGGPAGQPLAGVVGRMTIGAACRRQRLQSGDEARRIHHVKHAAHASRRLALRAARLARLPQRIGQRMLE